MFTKIAQFILLSYCVVQSCVIPEDGSLTENVNFSQVLCRDNYNDNGGKFQIYLFSFLWISYKWSSYISYYPNSGGRSYNEPALKDQSSVPVEKSDNKQKGRKVIIITDITDGIKLIITELKKFEEVRKDAVNSNYDDKSYGDFLNKNFKYMDTDKKLLEFVILVHEWTSSLLVLNTIGQSNYKNIFNFSRTCLLPPLNNNSKIMSHEDYESYSTILIGLIRYIQDYLYKQSEILLSVKSIRKIVNDNSKSGSELISLIKSIVLEANERLQNPEDTVSSSLSDKLFKFQLFAYRWILKIRVQIIYTERTKKFLQFLQEDQKKKTTNVSKREAEIMTEDSFFNNSFKTNNCNFKRTIRHTLEMQLFTTAWLLFEWFSNSPVGGRSFNDFQLPLDDQFDSLPTEKSDYELEDEEITVKDFMENIKLTKRQINKNLKSFEETAMDVDNDSSHNIRNTKSRILKRSNLKGNLDNLNFRRLRFILAVYRWISSIIIHRTLGKTAFGNMMPILRDCEPMFPIKEANKMKEEIEKVSDDIIYLAELLQAIVG
ncbi:PREDICTED: uncharacterized protein LOC108774180 [Cyphomyrmex costatus]|uniref:uncharacterized protein LOC108774180 n=1 Tax=Cyphomyrmex costatus TaxID=456900 RepID=UPI00085236DC|nr:PREDICTED: uncharacterized protein LOC108774180 [Cyphomyrmex costatus]